MSRPRRPGRRSRRDARRLLPRRLPALALAAAMAVAACGSGGAEDPLEPAEGGDETPSAGTLIDTASRTKSGIAAAGGNLDAFSPGECEQLRALRIAYVGPDLSELDAVGFGSLVVEDPTHIIAAYLDEVNANGGVNGRCVQASVHLWSFLDHYGSLDRICVDVPAQEPIMVLSLFMDVQAAACFTSGADLPVLGLWASVPETILRRSRGNLFVDDGTAGHLLGSSIALSRSAEIVPTSGQFGLLYGRPLGADPSRVEYNIGADITAAVEVTDDFNAMPGVVTHIPVQFGELGLLGAESRIRLLESNLTPAEIEAARTELTTLSPNEAALLAAMERFFLDEATRHRDSGVIAVYATAPWYEVRRMMRAAERVGWRPLWIANDIQIATLTLPGAPPAQVENFYLVSSRRAAGDELTALDRGCVGLRSAASGAPAFPHRHHTDAWSVLVATCDALDVTMSALSRISGPPSAGALMEQLADTRYETGHGGILTYTSEDHSGADRFRVLRADPECVLDEWGCMRAVTEWFEIGAASSQGSS